MCFQRFDSGSDTELPYDGVTTNKPFYYLLSNPIKKKTQSHDSATPDVWTYSNISGGRQVLDPSSGTTKQWFYEPSTLSDWKRGLVYKIERPNKDVIERVWETNRPHGQTSTPDVGNPFVRVETTSLANPAGSALIKTSTVQSDFDKNGNVVERVEYDFVA